MRGHMLGSREEWGSPGWVRESGGAAARDSGWDLAICFDEHNFRFCHYWHNWAGSARNENFGAHQYSPVFSGPPVKSFV
jgi:hypothetical protein